jgi:copper chaperone CopZ
MAALSARPFRDEDLMTTTTLHITGMTCGHCVSAVTSELTALDGVQDVAVDLVAGGTSSVVVSSTREVPLDELRAAVDEAGYELADD